MDDLTNFDGDIYRPAIGSSDESLSNFKVNLQIYNAIERWINRDKWGISTSFLFTKGCRNAIPVRNEEISPCKYSINPLKNHRILKKIFE